MATVLIIEADRLLAGNMKEVLARANFKSVWRRDLQKAINAVDKYQPAAIIMDFQTGGHGGIEFLYELRSYTEWQNLPVIIYSSTPPQLFQGLGPALEQLNAGCILYKPKDSLAKVVAELKALTAKTNVKTI